MAKQQKYRETFTTDEFVAAIKKVRQQGGKLKDVREALKLAPTDENQKVIQQTVAKLRSKGVQIPSFRGASKVPQMDLTAEQIAAYNQDLEEDAAEVKSGEAQEV